MMPEADVAALSTPGRWRRLRGGHGNAKLPARRARLPFRADGFRGVARGRKEIRLAQPRGRFPAVPGSDRCSTRGSSRPCAGLEEYGLEDINTIGSRENWTFEPGQAGDEARARCAEQFWETLHIDLRMVDTSDFTIAYVPTNIYSVGTAHEIILTRLQIKPVLFVSPAVEFPALDRCGNICADDPAGLALLERLDSEAPIKPNPRGIPSLWYMPLIGGTFFDGFGFAPYREKFRLGDDPDGRREERHPPRQSAVALSRIARARGAQTLGQQAQAVRHERRLAVVGL